jgi:hypothetical protein
VTGVTRDGDLEGLAAMIADLIDANLVAHPDRAKLLEGTGGKLKILANDVGSEVAITVGGGSVTVSSDVSGPRVVIETDSSTLMDLPNAKLLMGFPSVTDPIGRSVVRKVLTGDFKLRGAFAGFGLLSKVQRLLSVA